MKLSCEKYSGKIFAICKSQKNITFEIEKFFRCKIMWNTFGGIQKLLCIDGVGGWWGECQLFVDFTS